MAFDPPKKNILIIDFLQTKMQQRQQQKSSELILKACGVSSKEQPDVLDVTGGLARDSFILSSRGCQVTVIERSEVLADLIEDALQRYEQVKGIKLFTLKKMDAKDYLSQLKDKPTVIYLDPMFPETNKTALPKKETQILRSLVGHDEDADELLQMALQKAGKRVVVKRSRLAPYLANHKPDVQYMGRSTRFDVYFVTGKPASTQPR